MTLTLPDGPFEAYLFDCDGTIADSMPLHYVAWKRALDECGCSFPEDVFYAWGGMPAAEIVATLSAQQGLSLNAEQVADRKELMYYELLPQLKRRARGAGTDRAQFRARRAPPADGCRLRRHSRFGHAIPHDSRNHQSLRRAGLRGRLHAQQARS